LDLVLGQRRGGWAQLEEKGWDHLLGRRFPGIEQYLRNKARKEASRPNRGKIHAGKQLRVAGGGDGTASRWYRNMWLQTARALKKESSSCVS